MHKQTTAPRTPRVLPPAPHPSWTMPAPQSARIGDPKRFMARLWAEIDAA